MAQLRIGTCSWKFPSWHGLVYSAPRGIDYLQEYAREYDTVEVDQWFWSLFPPDHVRLPAPADVEAYRAAVPETFRFTVKAPNSVTLTHFYKKAKSDPLVANPHFLSVELCESFLSLLDPLGTQLGPVMFQFEYLNKQKMASQEPFLRQFEDFATRLPASHTYALETRNARYLNQPFFDMLARCGVSPVLLQGYWMPPVVEVYQAWRSFFLQHRTVVIRLLGPDRQGIEKRTGKQWDQIVAPKDEELAGIAGMAQDLLEEGVDVYINVNNHYEGSAPLTIGRIERLL